MDAGFRKWLGETRGFQQGDVIRTRDQFDALYRLYLNETTAAAAAAGNNNVQQIMQQAQAGETDSGSAIGSWISSWFGGNDPGKPVAQVAPQATPAPADGGRATRSASALLDMALQDAGTAAAAPSRQLPTGGRVAFEEAMPMAAPAAVEAPAPSPSPTPAAQRFAGEAFTQDQFRQMTGKDLAPGEYLDAKGRAFLVK